MAMKVFKFILSVILAIILVVSAGAAMGAFAITQAVSEKSVEEAIVKTDAVNQLTDNILANSTVNMGGEYGQEMKEILKSQAMTDFFTAYTAACLQNQLAGEEGTAGSGYYNEIGSDDLHQAFGHGIDECLQKGSISMDEGERQLFDAALNEAMPNLTEGINAVIQQMNLTSFVDEETDRNLQQARKITSPELRMAALALAAIACILLIVLRHERRTGLIWCGICILLVAGLLFVMSMMLSGTEEASTNFISLSERMMYIMVSYGAEKLAVMGGIAGGVLLVSGGIIKAVSR